MVKGRVVSGVHVRMTVVILLRVLFLYVLTCLPALFVVRWGK